MNHISDLLTNSSQAGNQAYGNDQSIQLIDMIETDDGLGDAPTLQTPEDKPRGRRKKMSGVEYAKMRAAEVQSRGNQETQLLQLTFPNWDDSRRGVPNPFIRGGLFTTRKSTKRLEIKSEKIASLSNIAIMYSGEELRQDDLSVWMAIINMAKDKNIGLPVFFTAYALIKDMGWRIHVDSYQRLKDSIERMKMTSMKISLNGGRSAYAGSLIRDYAFDALDDNGHEKWMVRLEPQIANLFLYDSTTMLEWEQRKKIGTRATLTLWLHTFYSSHREPIQYSVAKIHELCKSEEKKMANFKIRLRESLERLVEIGLLETYSISNDVLRVIRRKNQQLLPN